MAIKDLTIIHSNDMHGHFTGELDENVKLKGSLAQVCGYVKKIKEENPGAVYINAGDMFQGSLIDSDFQGLSTANILNMVPTDIVALGNHELDYGISHMLFVDKCLEAPIVNTNFKLKSQDVHLFRPYKVLEINGMNVLFIGLLTRTIVDQTKTEGLVGELVEIARTPVEIDNIFEILKEKGKHIDFTILVTHIGYKEDVKLAESLKPEWHVDMIVGAHSHTYLEEPVVVNNVLIVQAGMENTHVGHIDLKIDDKTGDIVDYKYKLVPVDEEHCPTDLMTKAMVSTYELDIDQKYSAFITRLKRRIDNNGRTNPTELGQLYADAFYNSLPGLDVFLLASSSMRCYYLDMTVTLQDLRESYPYDGKLYKFTVDGAQLRQMLTHALRDDVIIEVHDVMFQASSNLHIEYSKSEHKITKLTMRGEEVTDDKQYVIGMQEFYFENSEIGFGMKPEELQKYGKVSMAAPDAFTVLCDYMSSHKNIGGPIDDRLIIND